MHWLCNLWQTVTCRDITLIFCHIVSLHAPAFIRPSPHNAPIMLNQGPTFIQHDLILTNYIYSNSISIKGRSHSTSAYQHAPVTSWMFVNWLCDELSASSRIASVRFLPWYFSKWNSLSLSLVIVITTTNTVLRQKVYYK